jgi:hypothetical protein
VKTALPLVFAVLLLPAAAPAQVTLKREQSTLTVDAWSNGVYAVGADDARQDHADWQLDSAIRALALVRVPRFGRLGGRIVAEAFGGAQDGLAIGERSLVWTGSLGRLEYGERQGLPDVLTGYAPNPFTFTTAEFGPASGLSLDPGGGITQRFVADNNAPAFEALSVLGYGTALFGDRSRKLLYVSPKRGGWLGAASWASDADGTAVQELLQSGLVHEHYRDVDVLRIGASWSRLRSRAGDDLDSWLAGASLDLHQTWLLGLAATWNSGNVATPVPGWRSDAFGVTASVNWNKGPWTIGGFLQDARGREAQDVEHERLRAIETGLSYRTSTRLRLFCSWYRYRLDGRSDVPATDDNLLIAGARITL